MVLIAVNLIKSNLYYNISKDEIIGFNETNNCKTYDPAKFVLVLMIRGINFNWKQPIAYFSYQTVVQVLIYRT